MVLESKHIRKHASLMRDIRPMSERIADAMVTPEYSAAVFVCAAGAILFFDAALAYADLILLCLIIYFWWLTTRDRKLVFKLPASAKFKDSNNEGPGRSGEPEGILYLGNADKTNEEVWFTNSDARTHVLYLGTTGSGKTVGLTSMVSNAISWGSGFVYVDGKADTDLWSNLSSLVRRFGRDDDLLVLNYMTGNSDARAPSNTMNPFSSGSASYLTNMLVELMPPSEGDNAMWKERAVSLCAAMMPALTWKRDNQDMPLSVSVIRDYLALNNVIKLQRDDAIPEAIRSGLTGYLDTLPGFTAEAYDDNGKVKPPGPDTPQYDTNTANQQHGYLAMQFTRSLQSLGDDYGYIFDTQAADVDMLDVVLNRRILIVLIPALEKSGDEIANLGKIVAANMKGMMGSTLGATVEGESATVIENKPTHSATPFMTVFDEVGYYTASGMAVMAAQARSLGFSLIFSGQDLPAMKKRVREEANSITANCNIKLFGKLEDPTETKEFFEKTVGQAFVIESSGFQLAGSTSLGSYQDNKQGGIQARSRASYEELRGFTEGQAIVTFGEEVKKCQIFYSNPGHAKAMRVTRFVALPPTDEQTMKHAESITKLRDLMVSKNWTAAKADVAAPALPIIDALKDGFHVGDKETGDQIMAGICAVASAYAAENDISDVEAVSPQGANAPTAKTPAPAAAQKTQTPPAVTPTTETTTAEPSGGPNWKDIMSKPPAEGTRDDIPVTNPENVSTQTPPPVTAPPKQTRKALPPEIENILKTAAQDGRKTLFKGSEDA